MTTLISWNIYDLNKNINNSLKFIFSYKPDMICIQEFPQKNLELLKKYKEYKFAHSLDFIDPIKGKNLKSLLLIGIKKQYKPKFKKMKFPNIVRRNILNTVEGWKECTDGIYSDFTINKQKYRLINIHPACAATPTQREKELEFTFKHMDKKRENIICGDFNTFAKPKLNLFLGEFFGFKFRDYFDNERKDLGKIFRKQGLRNVFSHRITYPRFRLQLDHILIPYNKKIKHTKILRKGGRYSDHLPILLNFK